MTYDSSIGSPCGEGDLFALETELHYDVYFRQLDQVMRYLTECHAARTSAGDLEGTQITPLLERLRSTFKLVSLRHRARDEGAPGCRIDVTESGFPNQLEIGAIERDTVSRDEVLRSLPAAAMLRRILVDELFRSEQEPDEVLRELARREYLERLTPGTAFCTFAEGALTRLESPAAMTDRRYLFSWGCYDFVTNRPFLHVLTFEQDGQRPPLEENAEERHRFIDVLRKEGGRAPALGVLAMSIDDALETIHPKLLKRICVGPHYSRLLLGYCQPNAADSHEVYFRELLRCSHGRAEDFILLITEEQIFSRRQEVVRGVFSPSGRRREIFSIDEADAECAGRGVSAVQRFYLMPHELLQHAAQSSTVPLPDFARGRKFAIDQLGDLHGLTS